MPKLDPTTRYVNENQKRPDFVRTRVSPNDIPSNRKGVDRLTYYGFRKPRPFRFEDLAKRAVNSALPNHAYFLDTCFVKKEVPQHCWDALLSKTVCHPMDRLRTSGVAYSPTDKQFFPRGVRARSIWPRSTFRFFAAPDR